MSRIEELPEDYDESLHIDPASQPSQKTPVPLEAPASSQSLSVDSPSFSGSNPPRNGDRTTPALPPPMDSIKSRTPAEVLSALNRTPLFMTSLDDTDGGAGENVELEALKALAYEGTPVEVAENFREQGNECFRAKKWSDAVEFYTKGVVVLQEARKKRTGGHVEEEEENGKIEVQEERGLEEACLVNRAACNLELSMCMSSLTRLALILEEQKLNSNLYRKLPPYNDRLRRSLTHESIKRQSMVPLSSRLPSAR